MIANPRFLSPQMCVLPNREGAFVKPSDGWYHLIPKGEFETTIEGTDGSERKVMQVVDNAALTAIINRFKAEAAEPNFPGLRVDFDHFSYEPDQSSEAAGWIKELQNREDGVWGRVDFSDTGEAAVTGGRFKLCSPAWKPKDCEKLAANRYRPLRLDSVALTNNPNMKGMVPWTNTAAGISEVLGGTNMSNQTEALSRLCGYAGITLAPDANVNAGRAAYDQLFRNRRDLAVILNGDFPGHPFRGNQYGEGEGASESAERHSAAAESASEGATTGKDHFKAQGLHENAAAHHRAAADEAKAQGDKATAKYHTTMAKAHDRQAAFHAKQSHADVGGLVRNRESNTMGKEYTADRAELAKRIGLDGEPTDGQIHEHLGKLANCHTMLNAMFDAHKAIFKNRTMDELKAVVDSVPALREAQVEADLDQFKGVIENRETVKAALLANRDGTLSILKGIKAVVKNRADRAGAAPLHDAKSAKLSQPGSADTAGKPDVNEVRVLVNKISTRADEIIKNKRATPAEAFRQAQRELDPDGKTSAAPAVAGEE